MKPVGKIVISEKYNQETERKSDAPQKKSTTTKSSPIGPTSESNSGCDTDAESMEMPDEEEDDCNSSDQEVKPLAGKKMQKKLNDQRFTIETTVTVEKCGSDRKKGKKSGLNNEAKCLPIVPPEPSPLKKKKMSKRNTELSF